MKKVIIFLLIITTSLIAEWNIERLTSIYATVIANKVISPDSTKVAFYMRNSGYTTLSLFDIETEEITNLTLIELDNHEIFLPVWSPDSKKIYYHNKDYEWYIYDLDTQSTDFFSNGYQIAYNSDKTKLIQHTNRNIISIYNPENNNFDSLYTSTEENIRNIKPSKNDSNILYIVKNNGTPFSFNEPSSIISYNISTNEETVITDSLWMYYGYFEYFSTIPLSFVGYNDNGVEKVIFSKNIDDTSALMLYDGLNNNITFLKEITSHCDETWAIGKIIINEDLTELALTHGTLSIVNMEIYLSKYIIESNELELLSYNPGSFYSFGTPIDPVIINDNKILATFSDTAGYFSGNFEIYDLGYYIEETSISETTPKSSKLHQNYPNPFNPTTTIGYNLNKAADVKLNVYDVTGSLVKELNLGTKQAGHFITNFDGNNLSAGIYYYSLILDGVVSDTKKMILVK